MPSILQRFLERMHAAGALVPIAYFSIGAALYASTINIFFMSDDFEFLKIVAPAQSVSVIFDPLVGRFVRPLVVLMYYVNYHAFGLAPWAYHLSTLLPHFLNAWLVYLVARRLAGPGFDLWAFLSGLLFLVFAGHSEAVSWPAGIADPILTVCLLSAFLCYLRALEPGASALWLVGMCASIVVGSLAKELWVVFPGLLAAHIVSFGMLAARPARRRALTALAATSTLVAIYLVMRHVVFGSVAGGYAGLGSSLAAGIFVEQARAFFVRSFVPPTVYLADEFVRLLTVILPAATFLMLAWLARARTARVLVFSALALVIALVPVLPLTISISTTESERFVYLPSAFSCIFLVWAIKTVLSRRTPALLACALVIAVHAIRLVHANTQWQVAGALTKSIIDSYADAVLAHDPHGKASIFVLNLPDNAAGAYVFRNGFLSGVQLVRPDVAAWAARTGIIATQSVGAFGDPAYITNLGNGRFRVELLSTNRIIQPEIHSGPHYRIESQAPASYDVQFQPSVGAGLPLYLTRGRLKAADIFRKPSLPFGAIDLPSDGASCDAGSIRFMGWALDDEGIARVVLQHVEPDGSGAVRAPTVLGQVVWPTPHARPDVAQAFADYPDAHHPGWTYLVSCARAVTTPAGDMRVRVIAYDKGGREAVIGERVVRVQN